MSVEVLYQLRRDDPGASLRELDDVRLLADIATDDGITVSAGTEGTIVGVVREHETFIVEFAEPVGALAETCASNLKRIGRHAT